MLHQPSVAGFCAFGLANRRVGKPVRFKPALLALALAGVFAGTLSRAQTNPTGGVAVHGQASFSTPAANQLKVTTQNGAGTTHSAINWQSFSIAPGSSTNFQQPSAASTVVNRVVTNTPSTIFGTLSSNGKVVLVNQSGIAVGAGAVVDTAGFTASALRMTDADALAGRMRFGDGLGSSSAISVEGRITAHNGDVVLVAPNIDVGINALIQAPNGSTLLAAGQQVEITGRGLEGITMLVQAPGDQVRNLGSLQGTAVGIFAGTLHHSGEIQATTASLEGGTVVLKASGDAYVERAGKLLATGVKGGQVDVLGNRVAVADQAVIDVSGTRGGGTIRVGGDYQGKNPEIPNAQMTFVGAETALRANATESGNGGKVIVWADDVTRAYGSIAANAGAAGGNGGFIETSGHRYLDVAGSRVTAASPAGRAGTWLLDPADATILAGAVAAPVNLSGSTPFAPVAFAGISSITDGALNQAIDSGSNVILTTTNSGSSGLGTGDIIFDGASNGPVFITKTTNTFPSTLTLNADRNILFSSGTTTFQRTGSSGPGSSLSIALNPGTSVAGKIITNPVATAVLNGVADQVSVTVDNGRVWENSGTVTLNGQSVISLPNQTIYATFANLAGGALNVNSSANWSFLSDSTNQGGILNNAGTININGTAGGSNTSWEAVYSNLSGGNLNIAATKLVSVQNMGTIDGSVFVDAGGQLLVSEQHGGARAFSNTVFSGAGKIAINPGVTATFNNTSGTIGILGVGGTANDQSGTLAVQSYLQSGAGSAFTGAGGLFISSGFNHTAGTFNPTGVVNINQASGDLIFGDALNAASISLSASAGALTVNSALTTGGAMALSAATGLTINAGLNAGTNFNATTVGSPGPMTLNKGITAGGAMNLNLSGGLVVQSGAGVDAFLQSTGNQTIAAKYVEVNAAAADYAYIATTAGNQSITTSGKNASNEGLVIQNMGGGLAFIDGGSGSQTVTVNNADIVRVAGTAGDATLNGSGTQTILIQGSGQNSFQVGSAAAVGLSSVNGINQSITAGQAGQLGNIQVRGGVTDGKVSNIYNGSGTQTISTIGTLTVVGGTAPGLSGSPSACGNVGACGIIDNQTASAQNITAGAINLQGGSSGGYNFATIQALNAGATQSISVTGGGTMTLTGGTGNASTNNQANIYTQGTAQTINFSAGGVLQIAGGTVGSSNIAQVAELSSGSTQTVAGVTSIVLAGGGSGGGLGKGNSARLQSAGSQAVSAGGLTLLGGGGALTDNSAILNQTSTSGSQSITVGGGGAINMVGGSSTAGTVGSGHGSRALIESAGITQQIDFTSGGALVLTGGSAGQRNFAGVLADNGAQTITGSPSIALAGGSGGGITGEGNGAYVNAEIGSQNISASSINLTGGTGGTDNLAQIRQGSVSAGLVASQAITVTGGGTAALRGGGGSSNLARIQSFGTAQTLAFSGGGNLLLQGGTGASNNFARIHAFNGTQSITGSPNITVLGGASGGADLSGNFADILSNIAMQTIVAGNISLIAGAGGDENFAGIRSPVQRITAHGNMALTGGGASPSSDGTSGGGARVGGVFTITPTDLTLAVDGDLTLTGGSVAKGGSAIGANVVGGQPTSITITVGRDLTLNPGSVAGSGSRIGSPSISPAGGDISITAGGAIALNGNTAGDTVIRTVGNVSLNANLLSINNLVSGATIYANGLSGVAIGGAGQLMASGMGDSIKVVTGSGNFTNRAGPTALSVAAGGRWLVFSNDPANDTLGGLTFDFQQYGTTFANASAVQGSGNGVVYKVPAPPLKSVELEPQAEILVTFLDLFGKALDQKVKEDAQEKKARDAVVTEEEVCR